MNYDMVIYERLAEGILDWSRGVPNKRFNSAFVEEIKWSRETPNRREALVNIIKGYEIPDNFF